MIAVDPGTKEFTTYRKSGQGAFALAVYRDGHVLARRGDGVQLDFPTVQAAYDHFRIMHAVAQDHASWNICYHLEDHMPQ